MKYNRNFVLAVCTLFAIFGFMTGCTSTPGIKRTPAASFEGKYEGIFTGDFAGTWNMMITADGNLIGTLTDANGTAFDINGTIEKSGAFTASAAELNLSGKIDKTNGSTLYGSLSSGAKKAELAGYQSSKDIAADSDAVNTQLFNTVWEAKTAEISMAGMSQKAEYPISLTGDKNEKLYLYYLFQENNEIYSATKGENFSGNISSFNGLHKVKSVFKTAGDKIIMIAESTPGIKTTVIASFTITDGSILTINGTTFINIEGSVQTAAAKQIFTKTTQPIISEIKNAEDLHGR